jgi:hypothetical protein
VATAHPIRLRDADLNAGPARPASFGRESGAGFDALNLLFFMPS